VVLLHVVNSHAEELVNFVIAEGQDIACIVDFNNGVRPVLMRVEFTRIVFAYLPGDYRAPEHDFVADREWCDASSGRLATCVTGFVLICYAAQRGSDGVISAAEIVRVNPVVGLDRQRGFRSSRRMRATVKIKPGAQRVKVRRLVDGAIIGKISGFRTF